MKKDTVYQQLYDNIYKSATLESILINLEKLNEKLGNRKSTSTKDVEDDITKTITNTMLRDLLLGELHKGNNDLFSSKELTQLMTKVQDITNVARIVDMTIALPLTDSDLKEVVKQLEVKTGKKVIVNLKVDPTIIGGVIIQENKYIFDSSLKNHLKEYEGQWIKSLRQTSKA